MENLKRKPRKSILVTEGEQDPNRERKKSIKWDEESIEMHDKERGKTMKINEPKTPYVESLSDEEIKELEEEAVQDPIDNVTKENTIKNKKLGESVNAQSLQEKLEKAANQEGENGENEEKKNAEFKEKRKMHYNEGLKMKELLKKNWSKDEEEDE